MKKPGIIFGACCLIVFLSRCSDHVESLTLSHAEVAEMTATSIARSTAGMSMIIDTTLSVTTRVLDGGDYCEVTDDKLVKSGSPEGADHFFSYEFHYTYKVSCTGDVPQHMTTKVIFDGEFDTKRLTSQHAGVMDLVTTALDDASENYTVNVDYISNGTYESAISDKSEGNNTIEISAADIVVSKADGHIISGTANVVISGHLADQRMYNAGASVEFHSNGTFTIAVRGVNYSVNTNTGIVTQTS